jgi:transcriptional regulator with XRE-family HTH domain
MSLISPQKLFQILKRGKAVRSKFVESHLDKSIAYQIRSLRHEGKWTQLEFANKLGMGHPNNVSARLENPYYGKMTLSTLKQIAAACDVALVVWFIPFSRFIKWVTGTPYQDHGLSPSFYEIPSFRSEFGVEDVAIGAEADYDRQAVERATRRPPQHDFGNGGQGLGAPQAAYGD